MTGVLTGFAIIAVVISAGWLLARVGIVDAAAGRSLSTVVFYLAMPCLLFSLLRKENLGDVFSSGMAVSLGSCLVSAGVFLSVTWRRGASTSERTIGALTSCYVNAGNLGVPIAMYVLGSGADIAPILLIQLLLLAPTAFAVLDLAASGRRPSVRRLAVGPLRNPVTVGTGLGVLVSLTGVPLPAFVNGSVDLLGGLAVPGALLAYGIALRTGPTPLREVEALPVAVATVAKLVVQPMAAFLLATAAGLTAHRVLACTVLSALPTAQNVFVYASTYRTATVLARDVVFVTTLLALPAILLVTVLLT